MALQALFFASTRYWQPQQLQQAYAQLTALPCLADLDCHLVADGQLPALQAHQPAVFVPLSGGTQPVMLAAAQHCRAVSLFAAYSPGNYPQPLCHQLLQANAAPAFMDCLAVLRRTQPTWPAADAQQLGMHIRVFKAAEALQGATLLAIGPKEPWVISVADGQEAYQKLGVRLAYMPQEELAALYAGITPQQAQEHLNGLTGCPCDQPTPVDLQNAARMSAALQSATRRYQASAVAIACFNLLQTGTTACWGVS